MRNFLVDLHVYTNCWYNLIWCTGYTVVYFCVFITKRIFPLITTVYLISVRLFKMFIFELFDSLHFGNFFVICAVMKELGKVLKYSYNI